MRGGIAEGLDFFFYLDLFVEDSYVEGWLRVLIFFYLDLGVEDSCVEGWLRVLDFFFFVDLGF